MPLRLAATAHIPSLLDSTSLVSLYPAESSSLPLVNLCLNFLRILPSILFYTCSVVFNPETLTPDVDISLELERKISFSVPHAYLIMSNGLLDNCFETGEGHGISTLHSHWHLCI